MSLCRNYFWQESPFVFSNNVDFTLKKKKKEQNIFSQKLLLEENLTEGKECQLDSIASTLLLVLPNNQTKRTFERF